MRSLAFTFARCLEAHTSFRAAAPAAARKRDFSQRFQCDLGRPVLPQEIFSFLRRANQFYQLAPSQPGKRGGSRVVTYAGWDAVDATASARNGVAGRVSRERASS